MEENKKEPITMCFFCKNKNICKSVDELAEKYDDVMEMLNAVGPGLDIFCKFRQEVRYTPASTCSAFVPHHDFNNCCCEHDDRGHSGAM